MFYLRGHATHVTTKTPYRTSKSFSLLMLSIETNPPKRKGKRLHFPLLETQEHPAQSEYGQSEFLECYGNHTLIFHVVVCLLKLIFA